jgi:hypothetical protein
MSNLTIPNLNYYPAQTKGRDDKQGAHAHRASNTFQEIVKLWRNPRDYREYHPPEPDASSDEEQTLNLLA